MSPRPDRSYLSSNTQKPSSDPEKHREKEREREFGGWEAQCGSVEENRTEASCLIAALFASTSFKEHCCGCALLGGLVLPVRSSAGKTSSVMHLILKERERERRRDAKISSMKTFEK